MPTLTRLVTVGCGGLLIRLVCAADIPQEDQSNGPVGWASSPSTRGTLDIVYSCLFTVIACVWTVLHLDIPSPGQRSNLALKIKWAFANIILPEVILYAALVERYEARKEMGSRRLSYEPSEEMGGWIVPEKAPWRKRKANFEEATSQLLTSEQRRANKEATSDDSLKGDNPKLWTLTHEIYVRMGGLRLQVEDPTTPGQKKTHVLYNPDLIFPGKDQSLGDPRIAKAFCMSKNEILDKSKGDGFTKTITTIQLIYFVVSLSARKARHLPISQLEILTLAFAILAVLTFFALWDKPQGVEVPTTIHLDRLRGANAKRSAEDLLNHSRIQHAENSVFMTFYGLTIPHEVWALPLILTLIMAGFAGLHFLAWNFAFPSAAELTIWRAATLATLALPFPLYFLANCMCCVMCLKNTLLWFSFIAIYGLARLLLIAVAFSSLRSMPADTYVTTWSRYVPHIQ